MSISLRAATVEDREHLFRVFASTREHELSVLPWDPAQKEAFLAHQFTAREREYARLFGTEHHHVVEREGAPIGYLWLHHADTHIRVLDIALLPEHRGTGIGTALLKPIIEEARSRRVPVQLSVLSQGAARRLYERLGFAAVGEASVYQTMELVP